MSWFFIDTHAAGTIRYGWLPDEVVTEPAHARDLLKKLPQNDQLIKRAAGICVVAGPGSFSSVRTGVLVANMLARLLRVPLIGVSVKDAERLPKLSKRMYDGSFEPSVYVKPVYDQEPNITTPKRT